MAVYNDGNILPFIAGENLAGNRLVKFTTDNEVVYADAGDIPDGMTGVAPTASGATASVKLLNAGVHIMVASEAIDIGESVAVAADGTVQDAVAGTAGVIGKALEAATGTGDEISVLVNPLLFAGVAGS